MHEHVHRVRLVPRDHLAVGAAALEFHAHRGRQLCHRGLYPPALGPVAEMRPLHRALHVTQGLGDEVHAFELHQVGTGGDAQFHRRLPWGLAVVRGGQVR
jgi:hypothetical protein